MIVSILISLLFIHAVELPAVQEIKNELVIVSYIFIFAFNFTTTFFSLTH